MWFLIPKKSLQKVAVAENDFCRYSGIVYVVDLKPSLIVGGNDVCSKIQLNRSFTEYH